MAEIPEHTKSLVKNCMIQRLTTDESLDYLEKNNVKISERTFRRYKSEILEIQNALEVYSWGHIQEEQIQKMETKQTILKESWKLYQNSTKTSEKLAILKAIEKTSDELPGVVWDVNCYGYDIKSLKVNINYCGDNSLVSLRPERVAINSSEKFENNFDAKVKELIYLGDHIRSRVEVCGNDQFIVKIPNSYMGANLKEGATVKLSWKASDSRALDLN